MIRSVIMAANRQEILQMVAQLNTFKGQIETMREEGRSFYEKRDQQLISMSAQISKFIVSLSTTGVGTGPSSQEIPRPRLNQMAGTSTQKRTVALDQLPNTNGTSPKRFKENGAYGTDFTVDEEGFTIVHTDGACTNNGRAGAKAGIGVWWGHSLAHINLSEPVVGGRHTNNTAEIQAATLAIGQARGLSIRRLNIHTDSQFLINCITIWINNWKRNQWKTKDKKPVKNKEDLEALDHEIQQGDIEVKWTHVRGHSGIEGNEAADKLAVAGANKLKQ